MEQKGSRAVVAVVILLAVSFPRRATSAGSDCNRAAARPNGGARLLSSVVDTATAEQSQRRHLEALFNR